MSAIEHIVGLAFEQLPAALGTEVSEHGLEPDEVYAAVVAAVAEDLPGDDVTSWATIPAEQIETADVLARESGTVAGVWLAEMVFRHVLGNDISLQRHVSEGAHVGRGDRVLTVTGPTALLLTAERTALNFLCHLSGVATATSAWVNALTRAGAGARVRDTRKTIPGWRELEKYAVRAAGGINHRMSLSDEALVKDNHVLAAGGVVSAYEMIRERYPNVAVEVEVTTLEQVRELLVTDVDMILLDNMSTEQMRAAVELVAGAVQLEASGGLTIEDAQQVAATGVDFVAVGALTHSARVLDLAMDLRAPEQD